MTNRKSPVCRSPAKSFYYSQESPRLTPSTFYSTSFSSEDGYSCYRVLEEAVKEAKGKTQTVRDFQEKYLEVGLWPQQSVAELRGKYREERARRKELETEARRLKAQLARPCEGCVREKASHKATKQALEEAVALSSLLLKQVLHPTSQPESSSSPHPMSTP